MSSEKSDTEVPIPPETKDDKIKKHRESKIDRIFVSQYMNDAGATYVVTYSKIDNSSVGWSVDIENDGQKQADEFYKLDELKEPYEIKSFALYKKNLSLSYCVKDVKDGSDYYYKSCRYLF